MIVAKLAVNKIDKARLFKGKDNTYLDICLIETPNDKYGNDFMVTQSVSKEDREKGVKGAILGNAKLFGRRSAPAQQDQPAAKPAAQENLDEDCAF